MIINTKTYPNITFQHQLKEQKTYYKKSQLVNSFLCTNNSIFLPNKNVHFSQSFFKLAKEREKGYFLEILLHSLNYNAKRLDFINQNFLIDLHKSQFFILKEPIVSPIKSRIFKRRILFFSFDKILLNKLEYEIKKLKRPNVYTGKGVFSKEDTFVMKKKEKK